MNYRLIKKLPFEQSPEIGYISKPWLLIEDKPHYWNSNWFSPEKYPEFWEEVVEKDYEILSLIEGKFIYPCDKYSKDYINQLFNTLGVNIHSVKRKDGKVFTIGDKTEFGDIIKHFKIDNKSNLLIIGYKDCEDILEFVKHSKQKLFTTEDGVDIFEGESYYELITPDFHNKPCIWNILPTKTRGNINYDQEGNRRNGRIWFSTKELAEEYILYNKPLLTLKDVEELLCKNTSSYFLEKFKKRAQKLNNKN